MAISPMDIHLKEFGTVGSGGYDKEEVDAFLDVIADDLEKLINRNKQLEEAVAGMERKVAQFDEMQKTLQTALMNAQKSAGNILQEARSQAAAIIKKAQERSDRILEDLEREKSHILSSFSTIRDQIVQQIAPMRELLLKSQSLLIEYEEYATKADLAAAAESSEGEKEAAAEEVPASEPAVKAEEPAAVEEAAGEEEAPAEEAVAEAPAEEKGKYVWE
ncbi:MAG: DivIVA domain-containing protein [Actinobacteria bacterium]|nr:DivIVA domain-containing protein [Actinomycetota bacterium]